ncbi:MAG TPA: hypothetical protein VFA09_15855 [Ktedonobacteraceae bacterium]|nr:hypothetical protein [Ktedonobacteraceae bacterium]
MTNEEAMSYLTASLREVALLHLQPGETVLTAIYTHPTDAQTSNKWLWFTWYKPVHHPARAFILTPQRVLVVEDPTDPTVSTAERQYLFASCPLDHIIFFEMRSHLLDCALTLVMAGPTGLERATIDYNGVAEHAFLAAVACMRALIVGRPLPPYTRPDATYTRERSNSISDWHVALTGLQLRQENAVIHYLVAGEQVREWLSVPVIDESVWWQRFSIGAHEQPPTVVVRTDRQILLVKEVKRVIRGQTSYGTEAWLMPLERLQGARAVLDQRNEVWLTLKHMGVTDVVRLPLPTELTERALALVTPPLLRSEP